MSALASRGDIHTAEDQVCFTVYPIIDVPSRLIFAAKIIAVSVIANVVGVTIFVLAKRRRAAVR